jgi:hypothetical protein
VRATKGEAIDMKSKQILILLLLVGLFLVCEVNAQSDRSLIIALMKEQEPNYCDGPDVTVDAERVKIGRGKFGFIGSCRFGGGPQVLFLKVGRGFKKLLTIYIGMNGGVEMDTAMTKDYFNVIHYERGGNEIGVTIYRWNGSRYVAGRLRRMRVP